jgi:hypothetical protein
MKSTVSLKFIICLVVSFLPVGAHARPAQSAIDITQQSDTPALDWTPVQQLKSGREIELTVKGLPAGTRYFVAADESSITVLNLSDPALPEKARDVLRDLASHHPERLVAGFQGLRQFESREVRVGRPGIFVADRKVADFDRVVERLARTDVVRITAAANSSRFLRQEADEVVFPYHAVLPTAEEHATSPGSPVPAAGSRFANARRLVRTGAGRVKDVTGVLISDSSDRKIQFEVDGRAAFTIPYERITAMHYEQAEFPKRFLRRSNFYLTVHYSDATGLAAFETIRLLSARDVQPALEALERDTGLTFDRALTTRSFLGIPVRARVGASVAVTDWTGQATKGTITRLSASSLALDESAGAPRIFEATDVQKIRLLYSPKPYALAGFGMGASLGGLLTYLSAGLSGCFSETRTHNCHVAQAMGAVAAVTGGLGALVFTTVGAIYYPRNKAFDVYLGGARGPSKTSAFTIVPQVTKERKAVAVSVRF